MDFFVITRDTEDCTITFQFIIFTRVRSHKNRIFLPYLGWGCHVHLWQSSNASTRNWWVVNYFLIYNLFPTGSRLLFPGQDSWQATFGSIYFHQLEIYSWDTPSHVHGQNCCFVERNVSWSQKSWRLQV